MRKAAVITLSLFFLFAALFFVLHLSFPLPSLPAYSKVIYDRKGEVVHAFLSPDDKWRLRAEKHELTDKLKKAILYKEDKWFYYHPGVNPFSIIRAAVNNLVQRRRTSGASTITMQVARLLEPKQRTYINKLVEIFRALQLEWVYSKDEILNMYLNLAPYGRNIEGIKAASLIYFNKMPNHLSAAEIALLCIVPNRPSSLQPGRDNALLLDERNKWIKKFLKHRIFSKAEAADALNENLPTKFYPLPRLAPHFAIRLKDFGPENLYTTIDLEKQRRCEEITKQYIQSIYHKGIKNAAVLVIETLSGEIIAYVGSADFYNATDAGQVDGIRAVRQPGSALKPLLYGLCFDAGLFTPKSVLTDVPCHFDGYVPENYDNLFRGYVTLEYALENSLNVPAVKALDVLGKEKMIAALKRCGFSAIASREKKLGLSLVLGGCGVTLEQMTNLYRVFANDGKFSSLKFTKFSAQNFSYDTILSPSSCFMLSEILSKTTRPDLPANWESSHKLPRIAWKTGTSYGRRDAWSIGYNKNYTIGVWVGNFSNEGSPDLSGAATATPLLFQLFNTIDYNSPNEWYAMPKECGVRMACSRSGLVPSAMCKHSVIDYFIPLVSSNATCNHISELKVNPKEDISYCNNCLPQSGYKSIFVENHPPEMLRWYRENNMPIKPTPPHNPLCERIFRDNAPRIISPRNGNEYLIEKNEPQPISFLAECEDGVQFIYWWVNNRFVAKSKSGEQIFQSLPEGFHKISCSDDKGRNTDIWIKITEVNL
ncbi:MAG: penicillin-binding protein 1C [Chitinophagales bacterium]|nr:penicillin-binding protein 1C [Chitinophagales bacterium]MDW8273625.1 penicillin-binding protein 1C [Chitinophagales bacterium]